MPSTQKFKDERRRILITSAKLFNEKSFLSTSVDEIASGLKINKAMFDKRTREGDFFVASNSSPIGKTNLLIEKQTYPSSLAGIVTIRTQESTSQLFKCVWPKAM